MSEKSYLKQKHNALVLLADGKVFYGFGIGIEGKTFGEICFNTALSGYQEVLTDPSFYRQIITFTFPHIGNVGINKDDYESNNIFASGLILRENITNPSNYRAENNFEKWLIENNVTGICGVDTRALTQYIKDQGSQNTIIYYTTDKDIYDIDLEQLKKDISLLPDMNGAELAFEVTSSGIYKWDQALWSNDQEQFKDYSKEYHVVAIDYGIKYNILRSLRSFGCKVTVVPAKTSAKDILNLNPDGVFLSNGPGDPAATGEYAISVIQELIANNLPVFGICLGHQLLALALGLSTVKMKQGHRGINHPVYNHIKKSVEITSQNHGFMVENKNVPDNVIITHTSLFDGSVEGLAMKDKPVFSVQYHPESSPGPHDSRYLFKQFVDLIYTKEMEKINA